MDSVYYQTVVYLNFFLSGIGILFNVIACSAIVRARQSPPARMLFLFSLSVSDMMCSVFIGCEMLDGIFWLKNSSSFIIHVYADILNVIFSSGKLSCLLSMSFLSLDLVYAVRRPLQHKFLMSRRRGIVMTCVIWGVSSFLACCQIFHRHFFTIILFNNWPLEFILYPIITSLIMLYIVTVNILVYLNIRTHFRQMPSRTRKQKKAFITLCLVVLSFTVFVLPPSFINSPFLTEAKADVFFAFSRSLKCLELLNSICDPLIYTIRMPNIRRFFQDLTSAHYPSQRLYKKVNI